MTTALTTTASTALTVNRVPNIERVYVPNARTKSEIIDRIREASASVADIGLFLRALGPQLEKSDLKVVEYALARAHHREGKPLSFRQLVVITQQSADQVRNHLRMLQMQITDAFTPNQATRVMCRLMEMDE